MNKLKMTIVGALAVVGAWCAQAGTVTLTQANIFAAGTSSTQYRDVTMTTDDDYKFTGYALIAAHSKETSDKKYCQINTYSPPNSPRHVKIPEMPGPITNITMTVSSNKQTMGGGGNTKTLSFCAENGGTAISSDNGASKVSIGLTGNTLKTGYINASGGVRIWDITVSYAEDCTTFTNGFFHSEYVTDEFSSLSMKRPGGVQVSRSELKIADASAWVDCSQSSFTNMKLEPGSIFYQLSDFVPANGRVTLDGGDYRIHLVQNYGQDWIPNQTAGSWTFYVTERGGRISDDTWHFRGGTWVRPNIGSAFASGAAAGNTAGELALSFQNSVTIWRALATGGTVSFESGIYFVGNDNVAKASIADGTIFGTGDLALGNVAIQYNDTADNGDLKPAYVPNGKKLRLVAPSQIVGRMDNKTPQTITFGDGESNPFVREKGAFLVITDGKASTAHLDGTGVKAYVAGAKATVDEETRVIKEPIFGATRINNSDSMNVYRFDFLTQDEDGLLKCDEDVYTEGVEGGANTVARVTNATTLSEDALVAALNLDGYPLTIDDGATLRVGRDDMDYPAVVLTHHSTDSLGSDPCGDILGDGTLDFGASEGLIVAGRGDRSSRACAFNCRITGTGGLSIGGVSCQEALGSALDLGGENDYTGDTRISGAEVRIRNANALSMGPVRVYGGEYNGGRVRILAAGTYANEWFLNGTGAYLFSDSGLEPGCLVFNADATLAGSVHVEGMARISTSAATMGCSADYAFTAGTGVFEGEISGGEVQVVGSQPASMSKKPIVFAHHNSYTGGTRIAFQDLVLRGDGDCGTGKVTMMDGSTLTFENTADKTFPNALEGVGTVKLAGTAPVHFTGGVKRESWCDLKLDLADTAPVFTEAPAFATVTNSVAETARMTLKGDMTLDPASYDYFDPNVRLKVDGGTVDLCGGTLTVERAESLNGGKFVNGELIETNPDPSVQTVTVEPAAVTGAKTVNVYTNETVEVSGPPYVVYTNAAVTVTYTADAGYEFAGGAATWTTNVTANADTVAVTIPVNEQPQEKKPCTDCITFSADKSFGIRLNKGTDTTTPTVKLEYSTDQLNWKTFNVDTGYNAEPDGETYKLHIRGTGNSTFAGGISTSRSHSFTNTVGSAATAIACSGNALTLLDYEKVAKGEEPTMNDCAFAFLFNGFAALTAAPALPATTLVKSCYYSMFKNCTSLTSAPALNATTLAERCHQSMFYNCTSLTAAPALPATTLAQYCYSQMFDGCTSLTAAPTLPATTLADYCYQGMFYGCTSLTAAPALPATTLAQQCYQGMFQKCTSLVVNEDAPGKEWKIAATPGTGVTSWGRNMFTGTGGNIPSPPELNTTYYIASAPKETDCITFSADKSFGIKLVKGTDKTTPPPTVALEYSTDQLNWQTFDVDTGYDAKLDGTTYKLHIRGTGNSTFAAATSAKKAHCFTITATSAATAIACSGNALTLLDYETVAKGEEPTMNDFAFCYLFSGFAALTAAPALPATTLAVRCYQSMFSGCTSLTTAPALNATKLADYCYSSMFTGCTSLTAAPELPATTLENACYFSMFGGCTSLTAAPALPATTLKQACYFNMFAGCTSLVVNKAAPGLDWKIPATTDPGQAVSGMFMGTGGDVTGAPDLNTTYYTGAKKEVVGDVTLWRYGDQVGVSVAGELTKALADSIKDQGITNLVVGAGVTGVGAGAFEGWRSLRDVTISTNCTAIGADAFHRCQNVTNVTVQAEETVAVGDYAFYRCNSLEKLSFAHLPSWGETPFSFYSAIYMKDGIPEVYAIPNVEITGYTQVLKGSNDLETWTPVGDETKKDYKFFKIELVAPY